MLFPARLGGDFVIVMEIRSWLNLLSDFVSDFGHTKSRKSVSGFPARWCLLYKGARLFRYMPVDEFFYQRRGLSLIHI